MSNWMDLLETELAPPPKAVGLFVGEMSSLVWDKVMRAVKSYDLYYRVTSPQDFSYSTSAIGARVAFLVVNPTTEVLKALEKVVRSGGRTEAIYIMVDGDIASSQKEHFEYLKKRAQASKMYYLVNSPKSDSAKEKLISYFIVRWAVTQELSFRVASALEYSPGMLYEFDKQFRLCTDGQVLPSTQSRKLVDELLGSDTSTMVVTRILSQTPVDLLFNSDFTYRVLSFLHGLLTNAKRIQSAWKDGAYNVSTLSKSTGLTQFNVSRSIGIAERYSPNQLNKCEDLVLFGMENVERNPEVLSVVSRLWGR